MEVVILNNGSSDNTADIIKKYLDDSRIKYCRNDRNEPEYSKKLLYKYASGKFGKIICDDDYLINSSHISQGVKMMMENNLNVVFAHEIMRKERNKGAPFFYEKKALLPEINDAEYWVDNLCRNGINIPNFFSAAVFDIEKAKSLKAFSNLIYGPDYEIGLKMMLSGPSGYLNGKQVILRVHSGNDGANQNVQIAFEGAKLFDRVREYGESLGLDSSKMRDFKLRGLVAFSIHLLFPLWMRDYGCSLRSLMNFYRRVHQLDNMIKPAFLFNLSTIKKILSIKYTNNKFFNLLEYLYRKKGFGKSILIKDIN
jgi:glycosyltransferase involved in cell wall biosynthesis